MVKVKVTRPGCKFVVDGEEHTIDSPAFDVSDEVAERHSPLILELLEASGFMASASVEAEDQEE